MVIVQTNNQKVSEAISQALRMARTARDMTMQQVADAAGVSTNTICNIERSQNLPTAKTLDALFEALGVRVQFEIVDNE